MAGAVSLGIGGDDPVPGSPPSQDRSALAGDLFSRRAFDRCRPECGSTSFVSFTTNADLSSALAPGSVLTVSDRRGFSILARPRSRRGSFRVGGAAVVLLGAASLAGCGSTEPVERSSASPSISAARPWVVVYRTPTCGCCKSYEDYLRKHDFDVQSEVRDDLTPIRSQNGVPSEAASCHTVLLDGYAVEGHVPVEAIDKLLAERPAVDGIGIPGMPTNAPGMGEPDGRPLEVLSFNDDGVAPFATL